MNTKMQKTQKHPPPGGVERDVESTLHEMEYILRELERNAIRHWTVLISTEH